MILFMCIKKKELHIGPWIFMKVHWNEMALVWNLYVCQIVWIWRKQYCLYSDGKKYYLTGGISFNFLRKYLLKKMLFEYICFGCRVTIIKLRNINTTGFEWNCVENSENLTTLPQQKLEIVHSRTALHIPCCVAAVLVVTLLIAVC
jgi:hypothetical protein